MVRVCGPYIGTYHPVGVSLHEFDTEPHRGPFVGSVVGFSGE